MVYAVSLTIPIHCETGILAFDPSPCQEEHKDESVDGEIK